MTSPRPPEHDNRFAGRVRFNAPKSKASSPTRAPLSHVIVDMFGEASDGIAVDAKESFSFFRDVSSSQTCAS